MSWVITGTQKTINGTLTLGQAFGGGYFAGYISHTADGNPTHALIVASRVPSGGKAGASGSSYNTGFTTNYAWASGAALTNSVTTGVAAGPILNDYNARRLFDGTVNVAAMKANSYGIASYPAAKYIDDLNASGGFNGQTDWYLPSIFELDIAYFNLKPSTGTNDTSVGINDYSVPRRTGNYTSTSPGQTSIALFTTGSESFVAGLHWSSSEINASQASDANFNNGDQTNTIPKDFTKGVRAFRRIAL
jgi:hypothetical protein